MTKKNIAPVLVLSIICLAVALLLAVCNMITAPMIEAKNERAVTKSLQKAMPGGEFKSEPDVLEKGHPESIQKIYTEKNGKGYVVILVTKKGYTKKEIGLTVGIDSDGKITGMVITKNEESIIPTNLKPGGSYGNAYVGKGEDEIADLETGATVKYTEAAIKGAVEDAFVYLGFSEKKEGSDIPREETEITAKAEALSSSKVIETVIPEKSDYTKRIYKLQNGGYVAYTVAISPNYGTVETEVLIYVDTTGTIKAIEKVFYKVSDPAPDWGYNPPAEDIVNATFQSFVDKKAEDITSVDIAIGVTSTIGRVKDSITEALELGSAALLPRAEAEIITKAETLSGSTVADTVVPEESTYTKRIYKLQNGGYVAYTVAISPNYGTVETEVLIYVDTTGTIKGVEKVFYKVSDPAPDWGYNPPAEDIVNATFQSFVDKKAEDITSVDIAIGVTGTMGRVRDSIAEALELGSAVLLPREESEIKQKAEALSKSEISDTVIPKGTEYVKRIYTLKNGGYVAYTVAISPNYGTVETEVLIYVDTTGKIKAVEKVFYKVSDANPEYGYIPPAEDIVNTFFQSFVGKTADSIGSVDIAIGVTNTTTRVRDSITEALKHSADYLAKSDTNYAPRIIGISALCAAAAAAALFVIISKKRGASK